MKRNLILLIAAFLIVAEAKAQDSLVIEFESPIKNRFTIVGLLALRDANQTDFDEDGVPELVLFEEDDQGVTTKIVALDGRSHSRKWELDLTGVVQSSVNSLNKIEPGFVLTHRDSMIWRGFRRLRKFGGLGKSTAKTERMAIVSGEKRGILVIDPETNTPLLNLGDNFVLLAILDIDGDEKEELIIGNKALRKILIVGDGSTE